MFFFLILPSLSPSSLKFSHSSIQHLPIPLALLMESRHPRRRSLASLPDGVLLMVAMHVASSSPKPFADIGNLKLSTFRQVTSDRMVERCIAVDREYDRMTWGGLERKERYIAFVRRCSDAGNSEANCILGVIEPILSGNLPPGFDSSTCRSVYVGNIHVQVTEALLQEVFASCGPVEGCKLIRKEKSSYGFVDYYDRRSAALAIITLHGRHLFGQGIKVNWAYASGQREDTSGHYNIFVGDLSPEVTDSILYSCFSNYSSVSDARVMWDQKTGRSRGFGFVSFRNQQDAQDAINSNTGKWLGSRQIRCNWATKGAGTNEDKQNSDSKTGGEFANGSTENGQEMGNDDAPENSQQYTTVYVGNLAPEVTQADVHRLFHSLGAGVIEEVRIQRDKGFGFVRYSNNSEAASAIQLGNARVICGKPIKCSWGSKPTPAGTSSNPLSPPVAASFPGISASDLLAYEHSLALSKTGAGQAVMHAQGQHTLKQAVGIGPGASQAIYDGGFPNVAAAQQLMYY